MKKKETLNNNEYSMLDYLIRRCNAKGVCTLPLSTVSRDLNISEKDVLEAIKSLESLGFISVEGSPIKKVNVFLKSILASARSYQFIVPSTWKNKWEMIYGTKF